MLTVLVFLSSGGAHSPGQLSEGDQELGLLSGSTTVKSLTWEMGSNLCYQVRGSRMRRLPQERLVCSQCLDPALLWGPDPCPMPSPMPRRVQESGSHWTLRPSWRTVRSVGPRTPPSIASSWTPISSCPWVSPECVAGPKVTALTWGLSWGGPLRAPGFPPLHFHPFWGFPQSSPYP